MNLQTPEEMLERWNQVECQCDPSVGFLCEACHDIRVLRDLVKQNAKLLATCEKSLSRIEAEGRIQDSEMRAELILVIESAKGES